RLDQDRRDLADVFDLLIELDGAVGVQRVVLVVVVAVVMIVAVMGLCPGGTAFGGVFAAADHVPIELGFAMLENGVEAGQPDVNALVVGGVGLLHHPDDFPFFLVYVRRLA